MKKLWTWAKAFTASVANNDPASWGAHWVICIAGSVIPAVVAALIWTWTAGLVTGFLFSEVWLLVFWRREWLDIERHHRAGHDMPRYTRDGIRDIAGPIGNHLVWLLGILWEVFT